MILTNQREDILFFFWEDKQFNKKWSIDMKKRLTEEEIPMSNNHMEKCLRSLVNEKIQIKTI